MCQSLWGIITLVLCQEPWVAPLVVQQIIDLRYKIIQVMAISPMNF